MDKYNFYININYIFIFYIDIFVGLNLAILIKPTKENILGLRSDYNMASFDK